MALDGMILYVAIDPKKIERVATHLNGDLRAKDLCKHGQFSAVSLVRIDPMARTPNQVAGRLDSHLHIGQHISDVLMMKDRSCSTPLVVPRKFEAIFECRLHHADAADPEQGAAPVVCSVHHQNSVAFPPDQVFPGHADVIKDDFWLNREAQAELVLNSTNRNPWRIPRNENDAEAFASVFFKVGPAEQRIKPSSFTFPASYVGRKVFHPVNDVVIALKPCIGTKSSAWIE